MTGFVLTLWHQSPSLSYESKSSGVAVVRDSNLISSLGSSQYSIVKEEYQVRIELGAVLSPPSPKLSKKTDELA